MDIIICCDFLKTKLSGDLSAEVVAADSVMGWVNSVVSAVVSAQVSTIVSAQTVSVSVSTGSIGVSTISITVVGSGISFSLGFSLSLGIALLTGTGNGNVKGVDTGSTLNSVSVDTIVSSIMSVSSKTVSGVSGISQVTGISQTGVSTVSSQAIAVAVMAKTAIVVGIKDGGVGFSLSFSVGSDDKGGDNCNKGLHVAFVLRREAPSM